MTYEENFADPRVLRQRGVTKHGGIYFDVPYISHIEGNLWQGGCENGLVLPHDIEHVVSLYLWEQYLVTHELKSMFSMYDALDLTDSARASSQIDALAAWVNACVEDGPTLVHCHAGFNRTSLITARALMLAGRTAEDAIALLREQRSPAVLCNAAFEDRLRALDLVEAA